MRNAHWDSLADVDWDSSENLTWLRMRAYDVTNLIRGGSWDLMRKRNSLRRTGKLEKRFLTAIVVPIYDQRGNKWAEKKSEKSGEKEWRNKPIRVILSESHLTRYWALNMFMCATRIELDTCAKFTSGCSRCYSQITCGAKRVQRFPLYGLKYN